MGLSKVLSFLKIKKIEKTELKLKWKQVAPGLWELQTPIRKIKIPKEIQEQVEKNLREAASALSPVEASIIEWAIKISNERR